MPYQVARRPRSGPLTRGGRFRSAAAMGLLAARAARHLRKTTKRTRSGKSKPRTSSKKLAVSGLPRNRIGKDNGLIVSNQRVPHPRKGSVQYRRSVYGTAESFDKLWIGGSSIGTESTHFKTIAQAILVHYLNQMGDYRATNSSLSSGVFGRFQMKYAADAPSANAPASFVDGLLFGNASLEAMAVALGGEMAAKAGEGYYPRSILFETPDLLGNKLQDLNLGRHTITVSCKGRFRFQNVTKSDGESDNINAIDANPISGKIYTFRNQSPVFTPSYVETSATGVQAGIRALNTVVTPFEMYGVEHKGADAFVEPAPPLNPSSIWRNVSSTGNVVFPPGGFKTYTTSYLRSETIAKYCQNITQADIRVGLADHNSKYPPAGDSFMMCLRPTVKTTSEKIMMCYDTEYILKASIKKVRPSPLQVVNIIEWDPDPPPPNPCPSMADPVIGLTPPATATNWLYASNIPGTNDMQWYLYDLSNNNLGSYLSFNFGPPSTACAPTFAMNADSWWINDTVSFNAVNLGRRT